MPSNRDSRASRKRPVIYLRLLSIERCIVIVLFDYLHQVTGLLWILVHQLLPAQSLHLDGELLAIVADQALLEVQEHVVLLVGDSLALFARARRRRGRRWRRRD